MEDRDTPHDDNLDSELVVEDTIFNDLSIENFLSRNDSDNIQISKEDLNEFMIAIKDPYIDINLFDKLDDGIIFSTYSGEVAT